MTIKFNKRVDILMNLARKQSENDEFSTTTGIEDDVVLQHINDGQERIFNLITAKHQDVFVKEAPLYNVIAGTEEYDLPDDTHLENRVSTVEYSSTGQIRDLKILHPADLKTRRSNYEGYPSSYVRRSGAILLQPSPSLSGILRINYQYHIPELDIRRGKVSVATLTTDTITTLTLDTTEENFDSENINLADHICVVNKLGAQQMKMIPISAIDADTGIITVDAGFTFEDGETITVNDYVVIGFSATTHSRLPKTCERYLLKYTQWRLFKQDSSEDANDAIIELSQMERDIVDGFANVSDDITLIPDIEEDY